MMTKELLRRDASISYHCEHQRMEGETEKTIYMDGYFAGFRKGMKEVQRIMQLEPNNLERIEHINQLINKDYGKRNN